MEEYHRSNQFLSDARAVADKSGYDGKRLDIAPTTSPKKLVYITPAGKKIYFGQRGYGDFLYYSRYKPAEAEKHRRLYLARATKIGGAWGDDKYSANVLAQKILWAK